MSQLWWGQDEWVFTVQFENESNRSYLYIGGCFVWWSGSGMNEISSMMEWRDAACQEPLTWRERERPTHSGPYQRLRRVPSAHIWWQFNDWLDNLSWNFFYLKNWLLLKYFNWPTLLFSLGAQLTTDQPYSNQTHIVGCFIYTAWNITEYSLFQILNCGSHILIQ